MKVDGSAGGCVGRGVGTRVMVGVAVIVRVGLGLSGTVDGYMQADKARKRENISITMGDFFRFIFHSFLKIHSLFFTKIL